MPIHGTANYGDLSRSCSGDQVIKFHPSTDNWTLLIFLPLHGSHQTPGSKEDTEGLATTRLRAFKPALPRESSTVDTNYAGRCPYKPQLHQRTEVTICLTCPGLHQERISRSSTWRCWRALLTNNLSRKTDKSLKRAHPRKKCNMGMPTRRLDQRMATGAGSKNHTNSEKLTL